MAGITLDANVLLDDASHARASARAIDDAAREGALSVGPVTLAELVTLFARKHGAATAEERTRSFLGEAGVRVAAWRDEAAATAGLAYASHLKKRDLASVECAQCGHRAKHSSARCWRVVAWRAHIVTDFLIAAHALHDTGRILTRDPHLHARIEGLDVVVPKRG